MTTDTWAFAPGDQIVPGRFAAERLGGGNRFEAYVAWDETLHTTVVVKVVRPRQVDDPAARRAVATEAAVLEQVRHPVIVRSFDADLDGDRPHLVLEHLEAPRLSTLLRRHGALPVEQLLPLGVQLASALHYLRSLGLVHLDVKPVNVIMTGPPRLIDLGVARTVDAARRLDRAVGTRTYMAPEQCDPVRAGGVGAPADVWGLGTVLYEAAGGRPAFSRDDDAEHPQLHAHPPPLGNGVPARVSTLVGSCLARDLAARPTPAQVADELGELMALLPRKIVLSRLRPGLGS